MLLVLPDGADFVGALFGILKLGAVVVMLNPDLSREEAAAQLAYVRPALAVVSPAGFALYPPCATEAGWLEQGLPGRRRPGPPAGLGTAGAGGAATSRPSPPTATTRRSGSSPAAPPAGPRRWCSRTAPSPTPPSSTRKRTLGYTDNDVTLSVPKLYFGYATGSNLFFPFSVGASCVLFPEPPTPELLFRQIARHRATLLISVPTVLQRMADFPGAAGRDLASLRCVTSAGEALPPSLYHRFLELFGVELLDGLGTAEMWHIFVTNRPGEVRPGTLGRAVDGFAVSARDEEGRPVGPGEIGRLWVSGGSLAHGYWQNFEKTAEAFRGDTYVAGDLVVDRRRRRRHLLRPRRRRAQGGRPLAGARRGRGRAARPRGGRRMRGDRRRRRGRPGQALRLRAAQGGAARRSRSPAQGPGAREAGRLQTPAPGLRARFLSPHPPRQSRPRRLARPAAGARSMGST